MQVVVTQPESPLPASKLKFPARYLLRGGERGGGEEVHRKPWPRPWPRPRPGRLIPLPGGKNPIIAQWALAQGLGQGQGPWVNCFALRNSQQLTLETSIGSQLLRNSWPLLQAW